MRPPFALHTAGDRDLEVNRSVAAGHVFGSTSRGDATETSSIDHLVRTWSGTGLNGGGKLIPAHADIALQA